MAVTDQTNTTLEGIAARMKECSQFVICGHVNPDGDCLGSQLALAHALESLGKKVTCVLVAPDTVEYGLQFLPGVRNMVPAQDYVGAVEAFVAVDVPTSARIGAAAALQEQAQVTFTLDHHAVDSCMAQFNYVDPDEPAAGMIIWKLIAALGVAPDANMATCCYTALMTDTGRFQYQNTDAECFAAAAAMVHAGASPAECSREVYQNRSMASFKLEATMLDNMVSSADGQWVLSYLTKDDFSRFGAVKADAEPLIDVLRSLRDVRVACVLREQEDGVRGSLRAKDNVIDVAALARHIGGGGHKAAAGFTYEGTLDQARVQLPVLLDELVQQSRG